MITAVDVGLLEPGTGDAAALIGDRAYLDAMVQVEFALVAALARAGIAPDSMRTEDAGPFVPGALDLARVAAGSRGGGNPVIPLLAALRGALRDDVRHWLHLGATSQDVLDSASMLVALRVRARVSASLQPVLDGLATLAEQHRTTPAVARTIGQQAAPTVFGLRVAVLLDGIVRALQHLQALELPAQLGGSVGTLAVLTDVAGEDGADAVRRVFAAELGLAFRPTVWHVERGPIAELGAALTVLIGALGRLGLEVVQGTRFELGELHLALGEGEGGSSAMPQKQNPVAAMLLVAAARRAPGLAATLFGAQLALDDRPAGDWQAEWQPLRELLRLAVESAALAAEVVATLDVDVARLREHLDDSRGALHAERAQWALVPVVGRPAAGEMVRSALGSDDFVSALLEAAMADPAAEPAVERIRAVTDPGTSPGLADRMIDAAVAAARSER